VLFRRTWWQATTPEATVTRLGPAAGWQIWWRLAQKVDLMPTTDFTRFTKGRNRANRFTLSKTFASSV